MNEQTWRAWHLHCREACWCSGSCLGSIDIVRSLIHHPVIFLLTYTTKQFTEDREVAQIAGE